MSGFEHIPEQAEDVRAKPVAWTLAITVLAIAACVLVVFALQRFVLAGGGRAATSDVGVVPPAQPFSEPLQLEAERAAQRRELDTWTWADRDAHRVRMPIDVAMDRYLRGAR